MRLLKTRCSTVLSETEEVVKDKSLTFIEKLLSIKNIDKGKVSSGDFLISEVDFLYVHDVTFPLVNHEFESMNGTRVWNPNKFLLNLDHEYPPSTENASRIHANMRKLAEKQNSLIQEGSNCHQYVLENIARPGMLIVGADSHTNTVGALNCGGIGLGTSDCAFILKYGQTWFKVPKSIRIKINGEVHQGVSVKDIALEVIATIGPEGANNCSLEWSGELVDSLNISQRAVLTNLSTEMGAHNSVIGYDTITKDFLMERGRSEFSPLPFNSDSSSYLNFFEIDASKVAPMVALPDGFKKIERVDETGNTEISISIIGTCTNGRLEDLRNIAAILKGKHVKQSVRLIVTPNSREVYIRALQEGIIETIVKAGATVTSSGCGACAGLQKGLVGPDDVVAFAGPRNFKGRLGSKEAKIYLVSPETAASSAVRGYLSNEAEVRG